MQCCWGHQLCVWWHSGQLFRLAWSFSLWCNFTCLCACRDTQHVCKHGVTCYICSKSICVGYRKNVLMLPFPPLTVLCMCIHSKAGRQYKHNRFGCVNSHCQGAHQELAQVVWAPALWTNLINLTWAHCTPDACCCHWCTCNAVVVIIMQCHHCDAHAMLWLISAYSAITVMHMQRCDCFHYVVPSCVVCSIE